MKFGFVRSRLGWIFAGVFVTFAILSWASALYICEEPNLWPGFGELFPCGDFIVLPGSPWWSLGKSILPIELAKKNNPIMTVAFFVLPIILNILIFYLAGFFIEKILKKTVLKTSQKSGD